MLVHRGATVQRCQVQACPGEEDLCTWSDLMMRVLRIASKICFTFYSFSYLHAEVHTIFKFLHKKRNKLNDTKVPPDQKRFKQHNGKSIAIHEITPFQQSQPKQNRLPTPINSITPPLVSLPIPYVPPPTTFPYPTTQNPPSSEKSPTYPEKHFYPRLTQ